MKRTQRLQALAGRLDALAAADDRRIQQAQQIAGLRRQGAKELHELCRSVVDELNPLLTRFRMELSPADYGDNGFRDPGKNVIQVDLRGRVVQITYEATDAYTSTEQFRIPYIIQGAIRWFNQERLDRDEMGEEWVFYSQERDGWRWYVVDPRSRRFSPFDADHLTSILEQLV